MKKAKRVINYIYVVVLIITSIAYVCAIAFGNENKNDDILETSMDELFFLVFFIPVWVGEIELFNGISFFTHKYHQSTNSIKFFNYCLMILSILCLTMEFLILTNSLWNYGINSETTILGVSWCTLPIMFLINIIIAVQKKISHK